MKHVIYKGEEYVFDLGKVILTFFVGFILGALLMIASASSAQTVIKDVLISSPLEDTEFVQSTITASIDRAQKPFWIEAQLYPVKVNGYADIEAFVDLNYKAICYLHFDNISCVKM